MCVTISDPLWFKLNLPVFTSSAFPGNTENWLCIFTYHCLSGKQIHFPLQGFQSRVWGAEERRLGLLFPEPSLPATCSGVLLTVIHNQAPKVLSSVPLSSTAPLPLSTPSWTLLTQRLFLVQELGVKGPGVLALGSLYIFGCSYSLLQNEQPGLDMCCCSALWRFRMPG